MQIHLPDQKQGSIHPSMMHAQYFSQAPILCSKNKSSSNFTYDFLTLMKIFALSLAKDTRLSLSKFNVGAT